MVAQDWETETLDIDMGRISNDDDLGLDLAGGRQGVDPVLENAVEDALKMLLRMLVNMLLQMLSCRLSMLRDLNIPGQATPAIKDIVLGPNLYLFLAKCAQMFLKFQRLLSILGHSCFNVKSSLSQLTRARQFGTTRCNVNMERSYPTNL